jgi:transcriptional regulator with XRE-family HTH domain
MNAGVARRAEGNTIALGIVALTGYLSALENGEKELGSAMLHAIRQEFGKSVDWLLKGKRDR